MSLFNTFVPSIAPLPRSEDAVAIATVVTPPSPPSPPLPLRALETVFSFALLSELHCVLAVSKLWSSAVVTMRPINASATMDLVSHPEGRSAALMALCSSRLARHVRNLSPSQWESCQPFPAEFLQILANTKDGCGFSNLQQLTCSNFVAPTGEGEALAPAVVFPSSLTTLQLSFVRNATDEQINSTILSVSRLPHLTSFVFVVYSPSRPGMSLAPLVSMKNLETFGFNEMKLTDTQVDEIRALANVKFFKFTPDASLASRLCRVPHSLKWEKLDDYFFQDDLSDIVPVLLPSLTSLGFAHREDRDVSFLTKLPNLQALHINCSGIGIYSVSQTRFDSLCEALKKCPKLTSLELHQCGISSAKLIDLLPHLPNLTNLTLYGMRHLDSLRCLASGPVTSTLTSLWVGDCPNMYPEEFVHIKHLKQLKQMSLRNAFTEQVDAATLAEYRPFNSILLPNLTLFNYAQH